jgi:hypothetical protein
MNLATAINGTGEGSSAVDAVNAYLDAFYSGDFVRARSVLGADFHFSGPFVEATGADAFLASAQALGRIVRGHRVRRQWVDGNEVSTLYDVTLETPLGSGTITMSEWHRVEDGHLMQGVVVFDTAPFRALLPAEPHRG